MTTLILKCNALVHNSDLLLECEFRVKYHKESKHAACDLYLSGYIFKYDIDRSIWAGPSTTTGVEHSRLRIVARDGHSQFQSLSLTPNEPCFIFSKSGVPSGDHATLAKAEQIFISFDIKLLTQDNKKTFYHIINHPSSYTGFPDTFDPNQYKPVDHNSIEDALPSYDTVVKSNPHPKPSSLALAPNLKRSSPHALGRPSKVAKPTAPAHDSPTELATPGPPFDPKGTLSPLADNGSPTEVATPASKFDSKGTLSPLASKPTSLGRDGRSPSSSEAASVVSTPCPKRSPSLGPNAQPHAVRAVLLQAIQQMKTQDALLKKTIQEALIAAAELERDMDHRAVDFEGKVAENEDQQKIIADDTRLELLETRDSVLEELDKEKASLLHKFNEDLEGLFEIWKAKCIDHFPWLQERDEFNKREHELNKQERQSNKRERQSNKRERELDQRERELDQREHRLDKREHQLDKRENELDKREREFQTA